MVQLFCFSCEKTAQKEKEYCFLKSYGEEIELSFCIGLGGCIYVRLANKSSLLTETG